MKVFVTGGSGFIGARFVKLLDGAGHRARCLVRETSDTRALRELDVELVHGDVTDRDSLLQGMAGCDRVVHLANLYEFWMRDRTAFRRVNVDGTRTVMEAALATGVAKVVHVSTMAVFGDAAWPVTETSEPGPRCFGEYARSKRAGDAVVWDLHEREGLPVVVVYPGAVVGPGDPKASGRYLRNIVRGAMPCQVLTGSVFPFVSVADVARGMLAAMETEGNIGERYLLVAENLTFGEVNAMLSEVSGAKLPGVTLPDPITMLLASLCTGLARLTGRPPMLDLSTDQMQMMRHGMRVDGGKAARELGVSYTPIRAVLAEAVGAMARE